MAPGIHVHDIRILVKEMPKHRGKYSAATHGSGLQDHNPKEELGYLGILDYLLNAEYGRGIHDKMETPEDRIGTYKIRVDIESQRLTAVERQRLHNIANTINRANMGEAREESFRQELSSRGPAQSREERKDPAF
jgi:hypothetical protein